MELGGQGDWAVRVAGTGVEVWGWGWKVEDWGCKVRVEVKGLKDGYLEGLRNGGGREVGRVKNRWVKDWRLRGW